MNGFRISMLAGAAALALAAGSVASAQGMSADGFYLKGFGGASFAQDEDVDHLASAGVRGLRVSASSEDLSYDTGYLLGAAIGYDITPSIAWELEYTYRSANASLGGEISGPGGRETLDRRGRGRDVQRRHGERHLQFPRNGGDGWRCSLMSGSGSAGRRSISTATRPTSNSPIRPWRG